MKFAGKVYSDDILVGNISANNMTELKRKASTLCNRYCRAIDTMILHRVNDEEVDGIKFLRINKLSPNNEIVRGKWN